MTKEEMLELSRLEQKDEGIEFTKLSGIKIGFFWMSLMYSIIAVSNLIFAFTKRGQMMEFYAASSMYWCFSASEGFKLYKFTGKKSAKFQFISGVIAAIGFFLNWFLRVIWP